MGIERPVMTKIDSQNIPSPSERSYFTP